MVFLIALGLAISFAMAFGRFEGTGLNAEASKTGFWVLLYFERLLSVFALLPIMISFASMMKSKMLQSAGVMSESSTLSASGASVDSDGQELLNQPLIGRGDDSQESYRASVRSSRAGSLLDEEMDEESEDGRAHEYKVGDKVWAQHRLDGLWYRGRVKQVVDKDTVEVDYVDYDVSDTVTHVCVCPDYQNFMGPSSPIEVKAFDRYVVVGFWFCWRLFTHTLPHVQSPLARASGRGQGERAPGA